jgi:Ca2+-binding RTX toxin-like protein
MGFEIADTTGLGDDLKGSLVVLLEGGGNPITAEEWETYVPPPGYMLNTPRAGWFNELIVLGSPFVPTGEITNVTTPDGYTWDSVAAVQRSVYPYIPVTVNGQTLSPQEIAYAITTPPPGIVFIDSNDKNHENIYYGTDGENGSAARLQYFIEDLWGNIYILKSLNAASSTDDLVAQAVADAVLPVGWTKPEPRYFTQDMVYGPSLSGPDDSIAHANEFRDSADSAWMQIEWAANGMTLNAAAEGGLPIWAGQKGGLLLGTSNHDTIYGAQGDDFFIASQGNDVYDGGRGINTISYDSAVADIKLAYADDGIGFVVTSHQGIDTLFNIDRVKLTDGEYATPDLREVAVVGIEFAATLDGVSTAITPSFFLGDESLKLHYQLIDTNPNIVIAGSNLNDFIALQGGGNNAVNGGGGDDVIDGGMGSTFFSSGGGSNTFFLDVRATGVSWSTITDFEVGADKATVWGWEKGISKIAYIDQSNGTAGFEGLTFHFENILPSDSARNSNWNSITLSGKSLSDFGVSSSEELIAQINAETNPYFSIGQTPPDQFGTHGYLHIA